MKKIMAIFVLCLALIAGSVIAHHPAEDIVDEDIYEMISEMVADTPHATIEFDDDMGTTTITAPSVSAAEDLIQDGLIATLSLLGDDVTDDMADGVEVTITFGGFFDPESIGLEVETQVQNQNENQYQYRHRNQNESGNTIRNDQDWGRQVFFEVNTLLKDTTDL